MKTRYVIAILAIVAMLIVAGALTGCKKKEVQSTEPTAPSESTKPVEVVETPMTPAGATIELTKFEMSQGDVSVKAGATITWVNNGDIKHKIQIKMGETVITNSEFLENGGEYEYTFEEPGTYIWLSAPYAGLVKGTVTVE